MEVVFADEKYQEFLAQIVDLLEDFTQRQQELHVLAEEIEVLARHDRAKEMAWKKLQRDLPDISEVSFLSFWAMLEETTEDIGREKENNEGAPPRPKEWKAVSPEKVRRVLTDLSRYGDRYFSIVEPALKPKYSSSNLLSLLLTNSVSDFEMLVAEIVRLLYGYFPEALDRPADQGKAYRWAEVVKSDSIEDFTRRVVEETVSNGFRDSFPKYLNVLLPFNISFRGKKQEFSEFFTSFEVEEVFQRRNIVVHNKGLASIIFIEWLKKHEPESLVQINEAVPTDRSYLLKASNTLIKLAFYVVTKVLLSTLRTKPIDHYYDTLDAVVYKALLTQNYELALALTGEEELIFPNATDRHKDVFRVNYWLAKKKTVGFNEEDLTEIRKWISRTGERDFDLAKSVLLGREEESVTLAMKLLKERVITTQNLMSWPLLEDLRGDTLNWKNVLSVRRTPYKSR